MRGRYFFDGKVVERIKSALIIQAGKKGAKENTKP